MTTQILDQNDGKLTVEFQADPKLVAQKLEEACNVLRKKQTISGFRKGKAPNFLVKKHCSAQIIPWVQQNLFNEAYQEFLFEHQIKPFGEPSISALHLEGNKFYCSWKMFTQPTAKLQNYKDLEVTIPESETPEMIADGLLAKLREECGSYQDYSPEDFVQDGDLVQFSYKRELEDNTFDEPKLETFLVGSNDPPMFSDLSEILSGLTAQETKTIIKNDEIYLFKLLSGQKKVPAELNDALAQRVGLTNFAQLEAKIQEQSQKFATQNKKQKLNQSFLSILLEKNPLELPSWYKETEAGEIKKSFGDEWEKLTAEEQNFYYQRRLEQAKISFLLEAIREVEPDVAFSDQELIALLKNKANYKTKEGQALLKTLNSPQKESLQQTLMLLRDEMTIEWLLSKNKLVS